MQTVSGIYHDITKDLTPEEKAEMQKDLLDFAAHSISEDHQPRSVVVKLKTVNKYLLKTVGFALFFVCVLFPDVSVDFCLQS